MHRPRQPRRHRAVRSVQHSLARLLRTRRHVTSGHRKMTWNTLMARGPVVPLKSPRWLCPRSMTCERSPSFLNERRTGSDGLAPVKVLTPAAPWGLTRLVWDRPRVRRIRYQGLVVLFPETTNRADERQGKDPQVGRSGKQLPERSLRVVQPKKLSRGPRRAHVNVALARCIQNPQQALGPGISQEQPEEGTHGLVCIFDI